MRNPSLLDNATDHLTNGLEAATDAVASSLGAATDVVATSLEAATDVVATSAARRLLGYRRLLAVLAAVTLGAWLYRRFATSDPEDAPADQRE